MQLVCRIQDSDGRGPYRWARGRRHGRMIGKKGVDVLNAVSVCDGISAASQACEGLDYNFLLLSEIEAFPRSVLKQRHRAVDQRRYRPEHAVAGRPVLWGDFTAIRPRHIRRFHGHADVDVLFGGTPCQSFSVAGKRGGLDDARGDLSLEYALLAYRLGVRWLLWENVPGVLSSSKGEDFAGILSAFTGRVVEVPRDGWQTAGIIPGAGPGQFGVAWRTFDAQYAGVPQRRRRVFVVGYLGDHRRAVAVLFDAESLQGHPAPRQEAGQTAPTIPSRSLGGGGLGTDFDCDGGIVAATLDSSFGRLQGCSGQDASHGHSHLVPVAYGGNNCSGPIDVATAVNACNSASGRMDFESETFIAFSCKDHGADVGDISPTLRSMGHDGSHANAGGQVAVAFNLRGREGGAMPEVDPDGLASQRAASGGSSRSYVAAFHENQRAEVSVSDTCGSLKVGGGKPWQGYPAAIQGMAIRRLTPRECTRLQGFPDDYLELTYANAEEAHAAQVLHELWREAGTYAREGWRPGVAASLLTPEILLTGVYVGRVSWGVAAECATARRTLSGAKPWGEEFVQSLRVIAERRPSPYRREHFEQLARELGRPVSELPYERAQAQAALLDSGLWETAQKKWPLRYALAKTKGGKAVEQADGPRYKALGNSWAVPCARWIVERMQQVDRI